VIESNSHHEVMEHPDTLYRLIRQRQAELDACADQRGSFVFAFVARLLGR
jgi:hypothetical protein